MKARLLKKLLNNTGYTVNNNEDYIAVGSPMCHNLISVDKKTLKLKYALDTFNKGRNALTSEHKPEELLFIWDKLQELIDNGQINDIINGQDKIEKRLPVYTYNDNGVVETYTDKYGYPNTDIDGNIMYDNSYFKTKAKAIQEGLENMEAGVKHLKRRVEEIDSELKKATERLKEEEGYLAHFKALKIKEFSK